MASNGKANANGKATKAAAEAKAPRVDDNAAKVADLLKKLATESSPLVKKRLRRQLRSLGHTGGLGKRKAKDAE